MRYYYRHREEEIERVQQRQDHLLEWVREVKAEQGCSKCDEDHPATLDYHHPNPDEKDRGVAKMAMDGLSKDRIREEMEKCELLCANCHRKEHW